MKKVDIIKTAKEVIELQSNSIANLEKFIDKNFQDVVNLLKNINGHLIVIGIGKSAIIGKNCSNFKFHRYIFNIYSWC